jgi:sugar phosphate isomerase/epimerase
VTTAGSVVAARVLSRAPEARALGLLPLGMPLGGQVYPHRQRVVDGGLQGFAGLMKDMKALGIGVVELDSSGYKEFAALADAKATRKVMDDNGIKCLSVHYTWAELRNKLNEALEWGNTVGEHPQVSVASLNGTYDRATNTVTLDNLKKAADEYNTIAEVARKAGCETTLHNEGFEHTKLDDGRLAYHVLFDLLDPKNVFMQYQMSSTRITGDPVMLFTKYPGRFRSLHLQGIPAAPPPSATPPPAAPAAGGAAPAAGGRAGGGGGGQVALGSPTDTLDWPKIFPAAKKPGGITNYFVEQNWDLFVQSIAYLKTLNV